MNLNEWGKKRAILNHDVLCNQLRNELARLREEPSSKTCLRIAMWPQRKDEYVDFLDSALYVLNPGEIVDTSLFNSWNPSQREQFKLYIRKLYNQLEDIEGQVVKTKALLSESISLINAFFEVSYENRTSQDIIEIQKKLEMLSKRISKLPHY